MVIEGMEVIDEIVGTARDFRDKPYEEQRIKSMTVDCFEQQYPEPEKA